METQVIEVDPLEDGRRVYQQAAAVLAEGELVALPTETVYGLGADAYNHDAVAKVFAAKERPSFDPLILHLANGRQLDEVCDVPEELKETVENLAREFWPGPMTLVLPKKDVVPDIATSGLPTVAVRVSAEKEYETNEMDEKNSSMFTLLHDTVHIAYLSCKSCR